MDEDETMDEAVSFALPPKAMGACWADWLCEKYKRRATAAPMD